jgi:trans-2,3-dihydro-3-hydroxyanthranilate isomerase
MVLVNSIAALRKANMNPAKYLALRKSGDFFSPHLFCLQGFTAEGQTFARHFGVPPDTMEDPFTGSASGGMGAFLWHYSLIPSPAFIAQQGHLMHRPGQGYVEVIGPKEDIETVKVGGTAVAVKQGEFLI